jgi:hypothetical protein
MLRKSIWVGAALALGAVNACAPEDEALGPRNQGSSSPPPSHIGAGAVAAPGSSAPGSSTPGSTTPGSTTPGGTSEAGASDAGVNESGGPPPIEAGPPPNCTSNVWNNLEACGWPGPTNTGVPAGTALTQSNGTLTVTVDGTVIDGKKIVGGIEVAAKNVVIKNSSISKSANGAGGSGVVNVHPGASATIENSTLDGTNSTHSCIWHEGTSMTAKGNNCFGVNDGIFSWATVEGGSGAGDNFDIEGNYLHDFTVNAANGHIDGYQTEGASNGVIRHNTIDVVEEQNASVSIWNSRTDADNIVIDDNLFAGAGFSIYVEDYSPSEQSPAGGYSVTNVKVTNNKFSTARYGCVGYWGVWYPRGNPTDAWNRTGNVVLETSVNIDANNPTFNGSLCN